MRFDAVALSCTNLHLNSNTYRTLNSCSQVPHEALRRDGTRIAWQQFKMV